MAEKVSYFACDKGFYILLQYSASVVRPHGTHNRKKFYNE